MTARGPVATLLAGLIDYAGLFPPAALSMSDAVARYAEHRRGADRAMLGRFVVPAARLAEFTAAVDRLPFGAPTPAEPWALAVLAAATDAPMLRTFVDAYGSCLLADVVEAKAEDVATIEGLATAFGPAVMVYVELPLHPDPTPLVTALARLGLRAKVRTGGLTPEAIPAAGDLRRFLATCVDAAVPFKATAGLHHPLRGEHPLTADAAGPRAMMFGFLNVFLAAAFLHAGVDADAVAPLLEERDPSAIVVGPDALRWRTLTLTTRELAAFRRTCGASFGSCSFDEPVHDLTGLHLA
ncbi:MAG: hypothetical protein P3A27_07450 [Gemmatimonadota bacterium]|nr:hypothetical protein [Gemmatimonadota bacterium]